MGFTPQVDGTAAIKNFSNYTSTATGTAANVTADIIQFPGNAAQTATSGGTTFFSSLKSLTGTAASAVASLAGVTVPTSAVVVGAIAAMGLGCELGTNWYQSNPDLWNEIGEAIYNLNPELSAGIYNGAPAVWTFIENGIGYVPQDVVETVSDILVANNVLSGEIVPTYSPVVNTTLPISGISLVELTNYCVSKYASDLRALGYTVVIAPDFWDNANEVINYVLQNVDYTIYGIEPYLVTTTGSSSDSYKVVGGIEVHWINNESYTVHSVSEGGVYSFVGGTEYYRRSATYVFYNTDSQTYSSRYSMSSTQHSSATYHQGYTNEYTFTADPSFNDFWNAGTVSSTYSYEGITAQVNANIRTVDQTFEDYYADWVAQGQPRVTSWYIDPATGEITTTETVTIPLEVPYAYPAAEEWVNPQADPAIDPLTQSEAQAGQLPDTNIDPAPYIQAIQDLLDKLVRDSEGEKGDPEQPTTDTGTTPALVIPTGSAQALFTVYNPTQAQLDTFGGWLWSSSFLDNLIKIIENPIDCIISLKKIFCTPTTSGSGNIYCGYLNSGASAALVSAQYTSVDLGSVEVPEYFYNATDYSPYTTVSMFLPFIGMVELSPYDLIGATVNVTYNIDCYNGDFLAEITCTKSGYEAVTYTYSGNCAVEYPITGSNHAALALSTAVTAVTAVASGGLSLAGMAGMAGSLRGQQSVNGQMSGNAGACGGKTPFIIIKRSIPKNATNYAKYYGYPAQKAMMIGNCSGYTRVKAMITNNIAGATGSEVEEIESLLKDGIIV